MVIERIKKPSLFFQANVFRKLTGSYRLFKSL